MKTQNRKIEYGNQLNKRNKLRTQMLWKCTTSKSTKNASQAKRQNIRANR